MTDFACAFQKNNGEIWLKLFLNFFYLNFFLDCTQINDLRGTFPVYL